jgi:hypothetical protein
MVPGCQNQFLYFLYDTMLFSAIYDDGTKPGYKSSTTTYNLSDNYKSNYCTTCSVRPSKSLVDVNFISIKLLCLLQVFYKATKARSFAWTNDYTVSAVASVTIGFIR